jgi:hypothetical protein
MDNERVIEPVNILLLDTHVPGQSVPSRTISTLGEIYSITYGVC